MAELNFGEFFCSLKNIGFMTERVCKNYVTAFFSKLSCGIVAAVILGDVCLNEYLIVGKTEFGLTSLRALMKLLS